jgi:phosphoribosylaminoimidazolecarboxamide formyltransferase/IMP cyclohydrolase
MSDLIAAKRALLSVSDKTGLVEFATALAGEFGIELISTGGTAAALRKAGLNVTDVSAVTGFPEMMDGRVKTLHPKIHGGLLALRDHPEHQAAMIQHGIQPIDLVCVNLYPFEKTVARPDVAFETAIENIDIGGPSMIRSAAKNHAFVLVVTSPGDYEKVLGDLRKHSGQTCGKHRLKMACKAFDTCSRYDAAIATYLSGALARQDAAGATKNTAVGEGETSPMPQRLTIELQRSADLRYGENPHQKAALYLGRQPAEASVAFARQLHGKELSYINLLDADAALATVKEFSTPACCIVKHMTPCGCAIGDSPAEAFARAYDGDPLAAFGGIVAINRPIDLETANAIAAIDKLLEVIVAPRFDPAAKDKLAARWKNVRLLEVGDIGDADATEFHMHRIAGGYLVQQRDLAGAQRDQWKSVANRQPTDAEWADMQFAWLVCKHVKSNAIAVAKSGMLLGAGAGQMDRVTSCRLAITKAADRAKAAVAASDAFFPFEDGPRILLEAGITAIIHPGGSVRDQQTIDLVNQFGAAMVFTGTRHFMH